MANAERRRRSSCSMWPAWSRPALMNCRLAAKLHIDRLYLPKQSPELNPVDHLWRPAKNNIAANRQYKNVDQEAGMVEAFIHHLSPMKTLRLAGILAKDFWLAEVCKNFWSPT